MNEGRGSCPVCDCLYDKPGDGVCGECATGEIYHSFVVDPLVGDCLYTTEYKGNVFQRCNRPLAEHFE
jgi:hypothetical protein